MQKSMSVVGAESVTGLTDIVGFHIKCKEAEMQLVVLCDLLGKSGTESGKSYLSEEKFTTHLHKRTLFFKFFYRNLC